MKTTNTEIRKTTRSDFGMGSLTKREYWNSRKRYLCITQFRFI